MTKALTILAPSDMLKLPPAMTHAEAVAMFPGWREPTDPPAVGEPVEVAMFAGRVGNPNHPGYPGKPWIERTTLLHVMRDGRGFFCSEAAQTGCVIAWRSMIDDALKLADKLGESVASLGASLAIQKAKEMRGER